MNNNFICRLGGSALAQCYKQLGDTPPDLDNPVALKSLFKVTQKLLKGKNHHLQIACSLPCNGFFYSS